MSTFSVPNVFVDGVSNYIFAASVNANFNAIVAAGNSITAQNIGAQGIYASNIIPTNAAQATFGGAQPYTFTQNVMITSAGVEVSGLGVPSLPAAFGTGDGLFQRGASTGSIIIGGSTGAAQLDAGLTVANAVTLSGLGGTNADLRLGATGVRFLTAGGMTATAAAATVGSGQVGYGGTSSTTVGASGTAAVLPAAPVGYIIINVNGANMKVPYYNP